MTRMQRFAIIGGITVPYAVGSLAFCRQIYYICGYAMSGVIFSVIIGALFAYSGVRETLSVTDSESFWTNLILGSFFWSVYVICGNLLIVRFVENCGSIFFPLVVWACAAIAVYSITAGLQKLEL